MIRSNSKKKSLSTKNSWNWVLDYNEAVLREDLADCWKCRRLWKKFCHGSKVNIVSKTLIVAQPKLLVVPKKKGVSKLKMWLLEKIRFGGAGMLTALTSCNDEILGNLAPFGQDLQLLCQIWCLQCTVMVDLVVGFYKKTPRPAKFALRILLSFTVQSMSSDCEVQELLSEFRERGLQNLMRNPPASTPHEETPIALTQPM